MKKLIMLISLLLSITVQAQVQEYNRRGNEAMDRKDYQEAKFWYEQGVSNCDRYSINRLTDIYKLDESMRVSMRIVMGKCLACLNEQALTKDTLVIKQLIDYYSEGIGTAKNEVSANYWQGQLEQLRDPASGIFIQRDPKDQMKFFAGYHASLLAPYGIQVGGIGKSVGWYVRLRSNFAFQTTQYDGEIVKFRQQNQLKIQQLNENDFYRVTGRYKETYLMGSAGMIVKTVSHFYVSAGIGYWDRKYSREFIRVSNGGTEEPASADWARVKNLSMNGITFDLDGTYVLSERFYVTMGASLMSFKYVYPNMGLGIFF